MSDGMDGWDGTVIPEQSAYKSHRRAVLIRILILILAVTNSCQQQWASVWCYLGLFWAIFASWNLLVILAVIRILILILAVTNSCQQQ